ncbi:MAG: hypothetical protein WAW16_08450 [Candidatus Cryosericum sp.]
MGTDTVVAKQASVVAETVASRLGNSADASLTLQIQEALLSHLAQPRVKMHPQYVSPLLNTMMNCPHSRKLQQLWEKS